MIDFHCHLDLYPDPPAVVREAKSRGTYVLSVTTTPRAWHGTLSLAVGATRIRTALGLHPQLLPERAGELPLFESLIPEAKYIGEIGLDGSAAHKQSMGVQTTVLESILSMVNRAGGRIMTLHSRSAATRVLASLKKFPNAGEFVLHWFTGSETELRAAIEMGAWFSIGPAMFASRRGLELCASMPRDRILTETDGPFAASKGAPLLPWDSALALEGLARLWRVDADEVAETVMANFKRLVARGGGAGEPGRMVYDHVD